MKRLLLFSILILLLFPAPGNVSADSKDDLAQCLSASGFKMYGESGCSACQLQKEYFGDSFRNITYIDCSKFRAVCDSKQLHGFPTWEDSTGKQYRGAIPLDLLGQLSGCNKSLTPTAISSKPTGKDTFSLPVIALPSFSIPEKYIAAFLAGLMSFLAPCLLPLFPAYFSVISGFTFAELYGLNFSRLRGRVFFSSLFFISGFSIVYTILGATGSVVGQLLDTYLSLLLKISGVILVVMGLLQLGVIHIDALRFDFAWNIQKRLTKLGFVSAIATGIAAALSWIPCVGPLLSPILLLSARSETVAQGALLLYIYSLGLSIPFILGGLFFPFVAEKLQQHRTTFRRFSQTAGVFLIIFGILLILEKYKIFIDLINPVINSFWAGLESLRR